MSTKPDQAQCVRIPDNARRGHYGAETGFCFRAAATLEFSIDCCHSRDVFSRQLLLLSRPRNQRAQLPPVDEQDLARSLAVAIPPVAILRKEPERAGNLRVREELTGELDDAVDVVLLDERLAHLQARGLAVGQLARGHHEAGRAAVLQMREEVQHPHRVGVARRERHLLRPPSMQARILVGDPIGAPAVLALGAVVERRIRQDVVGLEVACLSLKYELPSWMLPSRPWMNRFIRHRRYVKSLLSWPKNESWWLCFVKRSDCTNMPPDPQHGSKTTPFVGLEHRDERLDDA